MDGSHLELSLFLRIEIYCAVPGHSGLPYPSCRFRDYEFLIPTGQTSLWYLCQRLAVSDRFLLVEILVIHPRKSIIILKTPANRYPTRKQNSIWNIKPVLSLVSTTWSFSTSPGSLTSLPKPHSSSSTALASTVGATRTWFNTSSNKDMPSTASTSAAMVILPDSAVTSMTGVNTART